MPRLNWSSRQSPTDLDDTPAAPSLEFDYTHAGGAAPWPTKHRGIKFGPSLVTRAWAAGLFVYCEVQDWPHPVAVKKVQWNEAGCLEAVLPEGVVIPRRLFTRPTAAGLTVGGVLIEEDGG